MKKEYNTLSGRKIEIELPPIYRGGEGSVCLIINSKPAEVAKIYHNSQKAAKFYGKLLFMYRNPPFQHSPDYIRKAMVWPTDLLIDNGQFVGFIMPYIDKGIKLFSLNQPGFPSLNMDSCWQKFSMKDAHALEVRLKICYNLANAVNLLHNSKNYVIGDLKPENLLITPEGYFSVIDLDSIQIQNNNQLLYAANAYTPEYAPPEFHNGKLSFKEHCVPVSYDLFSLAVILYQTLLTIHPFQASHSSYTTISENIRNGLFVHGSRKNQLHVIPSVHQLFHNLPESIKQLFMRCFEHAHNKPALRPSAQEWTQVLLNEIKNYKGYYNTTNGADSKNKENPAHVVNTINNSKDMLSNKPNMNLNGKNYSRNNDYEENKKMNKQYIKKSTLKVRFKLYLRLLYLLTMIGLMIYLTIKFYPKIMNNDNIIDFRSNNCKKSELFGFYYGQMSENKGTKKTAFLKIFHKPEAAVDVWLSLKTSATHLPADEEVKFDERYNTFYSASLGEGMVTKLNTGKIIIQSKLQNSKSWYFEK